MFSGAAGQKMPAELDPHERTLVAWPCRDEIYPGPRMAEARAAHAEVARAIARVPPWGVEVAGGVEATPGRKDHSRLRAFMAAAKGA